MDKKEEVVEVEVKVFEENNEKSKESSQYLIYDHKNSRENNLQLFSACRRGKGHVLEDKPCQDYCATVIEDSYAILVDSDGVSACEKSDVGSRLACEATIETVREIKKLCNTEEEFVEVLQGVDFRNKIIYCWMKKVFEDCEIEKKENVNRYIELSKYGATLIFAVITSNWYVAGNIGDGQVMFFNSNIGIKVRSHSLKTSSVVECLVNEKCASESFQIACYPRKYFNGVLMSTDGIYDRLQSSKSFYYYAKQMKERFCSAETPWPHQPFLYEPEVNVQKDLWNLTSDDCSIVLAVDSKLTEPVISPVVETELSKFEAWEPIRLADDSATFLVKRDDKIYEMVVSSKSLVSCDSLESARLLSPEKRWSVEGINFSIYKRYKLESTEALYNGGKFRQHVSYPAESAKEVLFFWDKYCALKKELADKGYGLRGGASFLVQFAGESMWGHLTVKPEALCLQEETLKKNDLVERYFSNVLGVLMCGKERYPVFGTGYVVQGPVIKREHDETELCRVVKIEKKYRLKNLSTYPWNVSDGRSVPPEETISLEEGVNFQIDVAENIKIPCSYLPKEEL